MSKVHLQFKGLDKLLSRIDGYSEDVKKRMAFCIYDAFTHIEKTAKENLHQNHSVRTGTLVASIHTRADGLNAVVGTTVVYAPYVEYGTSRAAAKPYFGPAVDETIPVLKRKLKEALKA